MSKQPIITEIFTEADLAPLSDKQKGDMLYNYRNIKKALEKWDIHKQWRIAKRKMLQNAKEFQSDVWLLSRHNPNTRLHIYNDEVYLDNVGHLEKEDLQLILEIQTFR